MDREVKTKWVAALRSGEYKQTQGALKRPVSNMFCCLGVLCYLVAKDGKGDWDAVGRFGYDEVYVGGFPPERLVYDLGLSIPEVNTLANMNDYQGADFNYIANYIMKEM